MYQPLFFTFMPELYFIETLYIKYAAVVIYHTKSKTKKTYYKIQFLMYYRQMAKFHSHALLTGRIIIQLQSGYFYIECMKEDRKGRKYLKYKFVNCIENIMKGQNVEMN